MNKGVEWHLINLVTKISLFYIIPPETIAFELINFILKNSMEEPFMITTGINSCSNLEAKLEFG